MVTNSANRFIYLDESAIDENLFPLGGYSGANIEYTVHIPNKKTRLSILTAIEKT